MRTFCTFFTALAAVWHSCAGQSIAWVEHYGDIGEGVAGEELRLTGDGQGNMYGAGSFDGTAFDLGGNVFASAEIGNDLMLAKWNSSGEVVWAVSVLSECWMGDIVDVRDIVYDAYGDAVIVTGYFLAPMRFPTDTLFGGCIDQPGNMFIAKYGGDGEFLWARSASSQVNVSPNKLVLEGDSLIHVFGGASDGWATFAGPPDVTLPAGGFHAKYSSVGELLLAENITSASGSIIGAVRLPNGKFVLDGTFTADGNVLGSPVDMLSGSRVGYLALSDLANAPDWILPFRSNDEAFVRSCERSTNGDILLSGSFIGDLLLPTDTLYSSQGVANGFLAAIDINGALIWITQLFSPVQSSVSNGLSVDLDGGTYLAGTFKDELLVGSASLEALSTRQGFIARFDSSGICRSAQHFGKINYGISVQPTADGVYFSCAYDSVWTMGNYTITEPQGIPGQYSFLVLGKLDSLSGFTGISAMPLQQGTLNIYANPNKGTCTIDLPEQLQFTDDLLLSIYDQTGHLVQRIPLRYTNEGVALDIRAQAKGMYHVELGDGKQRYTGTIVFE